MCSIRKFKAFVFDMDGLIFDSERIVQRSWNISGQKLGLGNVGEHIYYTLGLNRASRKKYYEENIREDFPFDEFSQLTRKTFFEIGEEQYIVPTDKIYMRDPSGITLGEEYTLYLDAFGNISAADKSYDDGIQYAYMTAAAPSSKILSSTVEVKLFTKKNKFKIKNKNNTYG